MHADYIQLIAGNNYFIYTNNASSLMLILMPMHEILVE